MIGYIVKQEVGSVLLVSATPDYNNRYPAVWVRTQDTITIGEKAEIILKGEEVLTTNPGQAVAERITILPSETNDDSRRNAQEVLKEVLVKNAAMQIPTVKKFEYIAANNKWSIVVFDGKDELKKEIEYEIDD